MRSSSSRVLIAAITLCCGTAGALAEPVEVVFAIAAQAPASSKSLVPGGLPGFPEARFTNFNNKLYRSPTNNRWLIVPTTNATPTSQDQVLLVGSGLSAGVEAQEGVTVIGPGASGNEFINFSGLSVPRINDAGQWTMAFRIAGGTTIDDRLVRWNGASFTVVKVGDPVPASPGSTYVGVFNSACIANDGGMSFLATASPLSGAFESAFSDDGNALVIDIGVTVPGNQSDPSPWAWADIDTNSFLTDATGTRYIALGEVGTVATADKAVVVDGNVVIQEGSVIAGSSFTSPVASVASDGVWMESNGDWFARGSNADGIDWVVRNGAVIAAEGQPITPGATELWESFRDMKGDNAGNYIVNGNTNAGTLIDDVIVVNGQRVLARESDPVDLDGNGQFDDGLFLHLIQDRGTLNNDGFFYFASRLKDSPSSTAGANGSNNASLLRVRAVPGSACGSADFDGDGDVGTDADIEAFFACLGGNCCATCGSADFDGDGDTGTDADIEAFFRVLGGGNC